MLINIFDYQAHLTFGLVAVAPYSVAFFFLLSGLSTACHWFHFPFHDRAAEASIVWYRKVPSTAQSQRLLTQSKHRKVVREWCRLECACILAGRMICMLSARVELESCNSSMALQNDSRPIGSSRLVHKRHSTATRTAACAKCACDHRYGLWNPSRICPWDVSRHQEVSHVAPVPTLTAQIEYKLISLEAPWTKIEKNVRLEQIGRWLNGSYNFQVISVALADGIPAQPTKQICHWT